MISVTVDYSILFYVCAGCHNPWPTDTVEVMMRVGRFGCWQEARSVGAHVPPAHADITFPVRGMASWWLLRMPAHTVDSR